MSEPVKRYDPFGYDGLSALMHEDELGGWVRTENFEALEIERDALSQRCRNLEVVQQAALERSGRIKSAAGALGWTADREDGPLEFLIEQAQRCRELQEDRQRTADEPVAFVHGEHSAVCADAGAGYARKELRALLGKESEDHE